MSDIEKGQVSTTAAEVYEEFFVPALFQEWADRVADAAHIQPGQRVLDVACGTGLLARAVAERVGSSGSVIGLDPNPGMLAVAERKAPGIEWKQGTAEAIPFDDDSFDAVLCQFGLMFFTDRQSAIHEMTRVARPGGRIALAVWDSIDTSPGYAEMVKLLHRLFGDKAANGLRAPFIMGDTRQLGSLFKDARVKDLKITTHQGTARFPSLDDWIYTEIKGWVLADVLTDAQFEQLRQEAKQPLSQFVTRDGTVVFSAPAHIVTAVVE